MAEDVPNGVAASTYYIRHRNALLVQAEMSPLFVDYYLHLNDLQQRPLREVDRMEKDLLAALVLYASSRPWNEQFAWTINLKSPRANLFAAVDNEEGQVVGTIFEEGVRETQTSQFFAESVRRNQERQRSVTEFDGSSILEACEHHFLQSEQRTARLFELPEEHFLLVAAQPDCDLEWLNTLSSDEAKQILESEECSPLEERRYVWSCGCSHDRLVQLTSAACQQDDSDLFDGNNTLAVTCPRCGSSYRITREMVEAFRAGKTQGYGSS